MQYFKSLNLYGEQKYPFSYTLQRYAFGFYRKLQIACLSSHQYLHISLLTF